jgi:hypothetical protein
MPLSRSQKRVMIRELRDLVFRVCSGVGTVGGPMSA